MELPGYRGMQGESLSMDAALCGPVGASQLVIVTSGVHGAEGPCGSDAQVALLGDVDLHARLQAGQVALLLVHAVNPHGFSYLRRVNEDGIDLNRNFHDFELQPPVANESYAALHELLLPPEWPPTPAITHALDELARQHTPQALLHAVMQGQSSHAEGLFYTGKEPAWSNITLRALLQRHGSGRRRIAWIDVHSGLGPWGHGEKIFAGRGRAGELERARACWGSDVLSPLAGESVSQPLRGTVAGALYDECPQAALDCIALEFGTVPAQVMLDALRADHWLAMHPETGAAQRIAIRCEMAKAFYGEGEMWKGMVLGQTRAAVLQAVTSLAV